MKFYENEKIELHIKIILEYVNKLIATQKSLIYVRKF